MKEETLHPKVGALELAPKGLNSTAPDKLARSIASSYNFDHAAGPSGGSDDLDVWVFWHSIRKHLLLIIGITVLVTTLATIYAIRKPNVFQAEGRLQVNLETSPAAPGNSKGSLASEESSDPTYFNTQIQILNSPALLRRVVKTLDLEHNQVFLATQLSRSTSTWQKLMRIVHLQKPGQIPISSEVLPLSDSSTAQSREDLAEATRLAPFVETLKEQLAVERVIDEHARSEEKDTRLIDVKFEDSDPVLAAKVVNVVCDTFALSNLERRTSANVSTSDFLLKRISQLQAQIRTDEERLINYAKNNQILTLDPTQNTVVERLVGLNRQLLEAENDRKQAETAYQTALVPGAATALTSSELKTAEDKLTDLRQRRAQLLVENTEEWPEVKEITLQITELEKQIASRQSSSIANFLTTLETRYRQAVAREQALRSAFEQQRKETLSQNEAAINYKIIQQEIDTNKGLLEGLLQRSKENDVVLAGTPNNVLVLDYAVVPNRAIGPNRLWTITLAFVVGLIAATGLALGIEYFNDTIRSASDVEKQLHLPALAVIPSVGGRRQRRIGRSKSLRRLNGNNGMELLVNDHNNTALTETYRHLRTSVLLSATGPTPKTLVVSSSLPIEGKTTTAVNFAYSLAQTGAKVLLVDADLRRPRVHSIFGVENKNGLSTILAGQVTETAALSFIVPHEKSGLYLITSGVTTENSIELIGSEQMRDFIQMMQQRFTHVIFDSPPIAPCTDSVLLSSMVDGVLLVVHGGKSPRKVVQRSTQILNEVGARILGVVLNNTNVASDDYYYYTQHYSDYYKPGKETDQLID